MKVGYFSDNGRGFVGAVFDNKVFNLSLAASKAGNRVLTDLTGVLREERFNVGLFAGLYEQAKGGSSSGTLLRALPSLPLLRPGKIICLGLNYVEHAREGNVPVPKEPIYFEKAVSAVIAHNQPVMHLSHLGRIESGS